jgi:hypothetical protein
MSKKDKDRKAALKALRDLSENGKGPVRLAAAIELLRVSKNKQIGFQR